MILCMDKTTRRGIKKAYLYGRERRWNLGLVHVRFVYATQGSKGIIELS